MQNSVYIIVKYLQIFSVNTVEHSKYDRRQLHYFEYLPCHTLAVGVIKNDGTKVKDCLLLHVNNSENRGGIFLYRHNYLSRNFNLQTNKTYYITF
jgi:hypothetical protein